ncbi:hypothetical protein PHAVU_004G018800 [Phaseolus vulgaris]|uniref:FBD domain-containing protein n=1 Tax=Phaseolus vulgaris TaxID=3885 RepID=V7C1C7_PHAVU|nr:hypothetical protein PHAVU_004G018800g [Phaseolus vulgaris]ESW23105.1 hypothetical protein PHAVU_004G018800g [Phaseolus vulgaris]
MADIISNLPDSILCVLSKHWNLLSRSVTSMDFDYHGGDHGADRWEDRWGDEKACSRFVSSAYFFLLRRRHKDPSFHRFRLRFKSCYNHGEINTLIKHAMQISRRRLQHLDLNLHLFIEVPFFVFRCKTLVVLKLSHLVLKNIFFVNLPLLKTLHLNSVISIKCQDLLQQFLSRSPNLEDLVVQNFIVKNSVANTNTAEKLYRLFKLVTANVDLHLVPLEIVKNVKVLMTDTVCQQDLVFDLQNLVQFVWTQLLPIHQWLLVLEVLRHCPKLQTLANFIQFLKPMKKNQFCHAYFLFPTCLSSHLKSCCLHNYRGSVFEFKFAEYIMQNAKYLRTMKFCFDISTHPYDNSLRRE